MPQTTKPHATRNLRRKQLHNLIRRFNAHRAGLAQKAATFASQLNWQPFQRAPRLSAIGFLLVVTSILLGAIHPQDTHPPVVMNLPLPERLAATHTPMLEEEARWDTVVVAPGDTLESIFHGLNLSSRLLHHVVHLNDDTQKLTRLMPGQELFFRLDEQGEFIALKVEREDDAWLYVEKGPDDSLTSHLETRTIQHELQLASGQIDLSFYHAGKKAGLSDNLILKMANIFGWDIDFVLDIRKGDRFYVLYEEIRRDGEFLRDGEVLAATFINQDEVFQAVRFDAGDGPDYYAPDGRPMRKAFLRAPLNFLQVNSNFNPRRLHPVTKTVKPHRGIDYGANTGTPVWATGDGTVIAAAYNNLNGNYVFIRHPNNIVTKYLHFSKRAVRKGQRVRQGQVIGYVGATGRVTGTHLHYEFIVNGVHRNPRTVSLPEAKPIPGQKLAEFKVVSAPILKQLARLYSDSAPGLLLAQAQQSDPAGQAETNDG